MLLGKPSFLDTSNVRISRLRLGPVLRVHRGAQGDLNTLSLVVALPFSIRTAFGHPGKAGAPAWVVGPSDCPWHMAWLGLLLCFYLPSPAPVPPGLCAVSLPAFAGLSLTCRDA